MEVHLKPLFEEGEEKAARPIRMHPQPPVLTPDDATEAGRLCKKQIQVYVKRKRAFTATGVFARVSRAFIKAGKPWLRRALPEAEIYRLVDQQAKTARWEVRTVDMGDGRVPTLYYPTERIFRGWLGKHLPGDFEMLGRCRANHKGGRPPKRVALARFAMKCRRRKPPMKWTEIRGEWNYDHPGDDVSKEMVRGAARRWSDRLKRRRTK
jgi:hypothetical protein